LIDPGTLAGQGVFAFVVLAHLGGLLRLIAAGQQRTGQKENPARHYPSAFSYFIALHP
jgi:hypothetical protein